jgi:catalase
MLAKTYLFLQPIFIILLLHVPGLLLQVTHDVSHLSCADFLRAPGVQTPVIVRFSTGAAACALSVDVR